MLYTKPICHTQNRRRTYPMRPRTPIGSRVHTGQDRGLASPHRASLSCLELCSVPQRHMPPRERPCEIGGLSVRSDQCCSVIPCQGLSWTWASTLCIASLCIAEKKNVTCVYMYLLERTQARIEAWPPNIGRVCLAFELCSAPQRRMLLRERPCQIGGQ